MWYQQFERFRDVAVRVQQFETVLLILMLQTILSLGVFFCPWFQVDGPQAGSGFGHDRDRISRKTGQKDEQSFTLRGLCIWMSLKSCQARIPGKVWMYVATKASADATTVTWSMSIVVNRRKPSQPKHLGVTKNIIPIRVVVHW